MWKEILARLTFWAVVDEIKNFEYDDDGGGGLFFFFFWSDFFLSLSKSKTHVLLYSDL